jgi:hypothetical protein
VWTFLICLMIDDLPIIHKKKKRIDSKGDHSL